MLRHVSRSLFGRVSAASMKWSRQFSTDITAETTGDPKFTDSWKKTIPNMDPPKTPTSYMTPRPPTPSTIPAKLTVNLVLPYDSILAAKEVNLNKMFWSKPRSLALASDSPYRIKDPQYEGMKRFILKLMLYYSKQSQFIRSANAIYSRVLYQVDRPAIYDVFSLEETFKTTFSLLVLHMWLCLRRLKEEGKEGVELGQYVYEIYNHDLELRVSKAGVNLLLSKWMKELERIFYGNIVAYDAAIGKQDDLQNVIWRNVFSDDAAPKPSEGALLSVQAFTRYVRREASSLSLTDKDAIISGNFMFTLLVEEGSGNTDRVGK